MKIIVAIDGYAGTGKGTTAKGVAEKLGYKYIDTGSMYRAVTLYFLDNNLNWEGDLTDILLNIDLNFERSDVSKKYEIVLNGKNVEKEIRTMRVTNFVSEISDKSQVRDFLVKKEQGIGKDKGVVMDGRDIGSVVFPDAELKIFLVCDTEIRAERRRQELLQKGEDVSLQDIVENFNKRDQLDKKRTDVLFQKFGDSVVVIDTTFMNIDQQIDKVLELCDIVIESETILVTSNRFADLDGCACVYAYAELLNLQGIQAIAGYQDPQLEPEFIFKKLSIDLPNNGLDMANKVSKVVLVDVSNVGGNNFVKPEKVIEIIDHRQSSDEKNFINADIQIESVGSAATLVAERFQKLGLKPSKNSALLLYYTIVSHTVFFKTSVTVDRDKLIAKWLKDYCSPDDSLVKEMWKYKSQLTRPLEEFLLDELVLREWNQKKIAIIQLEILNVEGFLSKYLFDITSIVNRRMSQMGISYFLLSAIDLELIKNIFCVMDEDSARFFEELLKVNFKNSQAERDGILLRKEIWPKVEKFLL